MKLLRLCTRRIHARALRREGKALMRRYLALLDLFESSNTLERVVPSAIGLRRRAMSCALTALQIRHELENS